MRKNFIVTFTLLIVNILNGQFRPNYDRSENRIEDDEKKFSFGYFLGTNIMGYKVNPKAQRDINTDVEQTSENDGVNNYGLVYLRQENKIGFSVGLTAKMKINDYLDLKTEPGIYFSQRTLYFSNAPYSGSESNPNEDQYLNDTNVKREIKSSYIEIPLLLSLHGDRWFNTRPYIQGGIGYVRNLQSNEKKADDNGVGVFRTTTNNFDWQAEIGVEIYFKHFKLTPSIKGIFFFNNELVNDNTETPQYWTGSLNSISTRALLFSLKFE